MTVPPDNGGWTDPWADPATPTRQGPPYAGPPPTAPPLAHPPPYGGPPSWGQSSWGQPWGQPSWGPPSWGPPSWGQQPWAQQPWGPPAPQRPGPVVAGAVLAFVQAAMVLVASLYLWFFASLADLATSGGGTAYSSGTVRGLATEGSTLAGVQLLSAVALIVAGVLALARRSRAVHRGLIAAQVLQLLLAGFWAVRLGVLFDDGPGADPRSALLACTLFFALGPAVAVGLLLTRTGRRWFDGTPRA